MGFVSCKAEDSDDDLNAITGKNSDYSIAFKNDDTAVYRCYKPTFQKHLGGLCQITIDADSYENGTGTIGYIFDLESNPERAVKDPRTLCIVGYNLPKKGIYVSHYENVTDIEEENFGTELSENKAVEHPYLALGTSTAAHPMPLTKNDDGKYVFTVNVDGMTDSTKYTVEIYDGLVEKKDLASKQPKYTTSISLEDLYPTEATRPSKLKQNAAAVYANVFAGKELKASWHYADTYK